VPLVVKRNGEGAAIDVGHDVKLLLLRDIQEAESRQVPLERKAEGRKEGRKGGREEGWWQGGGKTVQRDGDVSELISN
jgi:hypothetical protein